MYSLASALVAAVSMAALARDKFPPFALNSLVAMPPELAPQISLNRW